MYKRHQYASKKPKLRPIRQLYIICPLTRTFNVYDSRPLIVPHKYIQPVEIPVLEYIDNTNYNHKFYNLVHNTPNEFTPSSEEQKIIKALELLCPLLQTIYITRLLAKLLKSSDTIHHIFPNRFLADDDP